MTEASRTLLPLVREPPEAAAVAVPAPDLPLRVMRVIASGAGTTASRHFQHLSSTFQHLESLRCGISATVKCSNDGAWHGRLRPGPQ